MGEAARHDDRVDAADGARRRARGARRRRRGSATASTTSCSQFEPGKRTTPTRRLMRQPPAAGSSTAASSITGLVRKRAHMSSTSARADASSAASSVEADGLADPHALRRRRSRGAGSDRSMVCPCGSAMPARRRTSTSTANRTDAHSRTPLRVLRAYPRPMSRRGLELSHEWGCHALRDTDTGDRVDPAALPLPGSLVERLAEWAARWDLTFDVERPDRPKVDGWVIDELGQRRRPPVEGRARPSCRPPTTRSSYVPPRTRSTASPPELPPDSGRLQGAQPSRRPASRRSDGR